MTMDRREILKIAPKWVTPVVATVVIPAHAQCSKDCEVTPQPTTTVAPAPTTTFIPGTTPPVTTPTTTPVPQEEPEPTTTEKPDKPVYGG